MASKNDLPKYPVVATEYTIQTPRGLVKAARLKDENGFYIQVTLPSDRGYVHHWEKKTLRGGEMRLTMPNVHEICEVIDEIFNHDDRLQDLARFGTLKKLKTKKAK